MSPTETTTEPTRRRFGLAHVAIAIVVLGFGAMWIYAWFLAPRGNLDRFPDRAWAARAEAVCAATAAEVDALPPASDFADVEPKAEALRQRAGVVDEARRLASLGVGGLLLFGVPDHKDVSGASAADPDGPVPVALRALRDAGLPVVLMADVCLCAYTTHGHCGVLVGDRVANDASLPRLVDAALGFPRASVAAPAGMAAITTPTPAMPVTDTV